MDMDVALWGTQLASGASYTGEKFEAVARMLLDAPPITQSGGISWRVQLEVLRVHVGRKA
jgi:hypothetical protein